MPLQPEAGASYLRNVICRRILGLVLIVTALALTPAAYASPPDPTWIAGLYDNADFDDVVLFITSGLGGVQPSLTWSPRVVALVVGVVPSVEISVPTSVSVASGPSRAPPLA
jgi:hypothetical protein